MCDVNKITYDNKKYVLKIPKRFSIHGNIIVTKLVKKLAPVPKIIAHDLSKKVIGKEYVLYEYIPGAPIMNPGRAELKQIIRAIKKINKAPMEGFGWLSPEGKGYWKTWDEFVFKILGEKLRKGIRKKKISSSFASRIQKKFWDNQELFMNVKPKLLKTDTSLGNYIFNDGKLVAVIDFDFTMSGDPLWQVGHFISMYPKLTKDFMDLYKLNKVQKKKVWFYAMLRMCNTLPDVKDPVWTKGIQQSLKRFWRNPTL